MTARAKADVRVGQKKPNQGRGRAKGGKICIFFHCICVSFSDTRKSGMNSYQQGQETDISFSAMS